MVPNHSKIGPGGGSFGEKLPPLPSATLDIYQIFSPVSGIVPHILNKSVLILPIYIQMVSFTTNYLIA